MYKFTLNYRNTDKRNLADPYSFTEGTTSATSDFIIVPNNVNTVYAQVNTGITIANISFYDNNRILLRSVNNSTTAAKPNNTRFVRMRFNKAQLDTPLRHCGVLFSLVTTFVPYYLSRVVNPVYKKLTRKFVKQSGQQYYREKLTGALKFVRHEFDLIYTIGLEDKSLLVVEDTDGILNDYVGYFYKTDCEFDEDNRIVTVDHTPQDFYEKFLGGLQKKFNLLDLGVTKSDIFYNKRPIYQIYVEGEPSITNYWGGVYSRKEINIDPVFDKNTLENTYNFLEYSSIYYVRENSGAHNNFKGTYRVNSSEDPYTGWGGLIERKYSTSTNNVAILKETRVIQIDFNPDITEYRYVIKDTTANIVYYVTPWVQSITYPDDYTYTGVVSGFQGSFTFSVKRVYMRKLLGGNNGSYGSQTPGNIQARGNNDIYEQNRNYPFTEKAGLGNLNIFGSLRSSNTEANFGKVPSRDVNDTILPNGGEYYLKPDGFGFVNNPNGGRSFLPIRVEPISEPLWGELSVWSNSRTNNRTFLQNSQNPNLHPWMDLWGQVDVNLKDCYRVWRIIEKLIRMVGANVKFSNSGYNSEFMFNGPASASSIFDFMRTTTPLTLETFSGMGYASVNDMDMYLTPKSNILVSDYENPANKADISLGQILSMLRDLYQLYWHIDTEGNLKIEHISWYDGGGEYPDFFGPGNLVGSDLTTLTEPKTHKKWGYNLKKYKFDKVDMPERLEFGFMDDSSPGFEGSAIDILSGFVKEGRIEDISLNGITTDIDYLLANPNEASKDGFCLLVLHNESRFMGYTPVFTAPDNEVHLQNGLASFPWVHKYMYPYSLPANKVVINNDEEDITAQNVTRYKKQEVYFPATQPINPYRLIRTSIGNGKVYSLEIDMQSLKVKAELRHDTE